MTTLFAILYTLGLCAGLVGLWLAGDRVVTTAVRLASALNVTKFFIGFIILAIAAGIPELGVAIVSGLGDVGEVSAGDVIGASLSDIGLVVAIVLICARSVPLKRSDRGKLIRMLFVVSGVLGFIFSIGYVDRTIGLFLTFFYGIALYFIWRKESPHDVWHDEVALVTEHIAEKKACNIKECAWISFLLAIGLGAVFFFSWLTVEAAVALASVFTTKLEVIGATICAIGTSLPELAMSLTALKTKEYELAIAPTLGSILEHAMLVLGILGMTSSRAIYFTGLHGAGVFMFIAFALMALFLWAKRPLARWQGIILITLYIAYLVYEAIQLY